MFDLDPLGRPVAILQILILLAIAAFLGWLIGRLIRSSQVEAKRKQLADRLQEVDDCKKTKTSAVVAPEPTLYVSEPVSTVVVTETKPEPLPADEPTISIAVAPPTTQQAEPSQEDVLNRVAARANELNFEKFGRATLFEADDLKEIIGVGPFLERKLHALGIYTFRQIAQFDKEDMEQVNDIIEFFPGRIERDDWVGQSRTLHEQKYGSLG